MYRPDSNASPRPGPDRKSIPATHRNGGPITEFLNVSLGEVLKAKAGQLGRTSGKRSMSVGRGDYDTP